MKRGYVKLYRKTIDSSIFTHEGMFKLWILCLLKANHKEAEVILPGILKPIPVKPGQFIMGRYELHREYHQADIQKRKYSRKCKPTPYTLIRWLLTLQYMQMLSIKTYNKYSIITITNWYLYQANEQQEVAESPINTKKCDSCTLNSPILAKSEHQKKSAKQGISTLLEDGSQENEHQVSNRRASSEHKQECIKNEEEIYSEARPHNSFSQISKKVIDHLNQTGNRNFTYSKANLQIIQARLKEGHTEEDCKKVINVKWADPDFDKKYFRPSTLFRPTKFEGYLNEESKEQSDESWDI